MKRSHLLLTAVMAVVRVSCLWGQVPETAPPQIAEVSAPVPSQFEKPQLALKASLSRSDGELPLNRARTQLDRNGIIDAQFQRRPWAWSSFVWEAPASNHLPLLFEEPNLERMGYPNACPISLFGPEECWWTDECIQPAVSGAHFLGNLAIVPYRCGVQSACEPVYTLGHDHPGSPRCFRRHLLPLELSGSIYQAGFVTGLVFLIP